MLHIENLTPTSFGERGTAPVIKHQQRQTRQRKTLSCLECRRRKLKCDRGTPCTRCKRSGKRFECTYASDDIQEQPQKAGNHNAKASGREDSSLATVGDEVQNGNQECSTADDSSGERGATGSGTDATFFTLPLNTRTSSGDIFPSHGSTVPKLDNHDLRPISAKYEQGKVKYRGPTHWWYLANEFKELSPFLGGSPAPGFENTAARLKKAKQLYKSRMRRNRNYPFGNDHVPTPSSIESIFSILPPREVTDMFIVNYFNTFETTHRLLHIPTFNIELEQFWEDPTAVSNAWLAQLLMMLALGCPRGQREKDKSLVDSLLDHAEAYLNSTAFMYKPDLSTLRAMCMMVLAKQIDIVSFDDSDAVWSFIGLIQRLAITIGLHRNPDYIDGMPILMREMRKRIWTTIMFIDLQNSIESGMPTLITPMAFDCPPPANFNDSDLPAILDGARPHNLEVFTDSTYQILQAKSFDITFQVMSYIQLNATTPDVAKNSSLDNKVRVFLKESSQIFDNAQNLHLHDPNRSRTIILQKTITEMYLRRLLLEIHRPHSLVWLSTQSESYYSSLECSFAMIVLQRTFYEDIDDTSIEWFAELFKGDFFVAAVYVCLGLWQDHLVSSQSPTDGSVHRFQLLEKQTATLALKACLDIMGKKIALSVDHFKSHLGLAMMIFGLEARNAGNSALAAMEKAARVTFAALERAFPGKTEAIKSSCSELSLSPTSQLGSPIQPRSLSQVLGRDRATPCSVVTSGSDQSSFLNFIVDESWQMEPCAIPGDLLFMESSNGM